jgi:hypothetical protein
MNSFQKTPALITGLIISIIVCTLTIQHYSNDVIKLIHYFISIKDDIFHTFSQSFGYVFGFYIAINLFLTLIGRNMHTWNKESSANNIIKNEFKKILIFRLVFFNSLFYISCYLSFIGVLPTSTFNIFHLLSNICIVIILSFELYWGLFKWTFANKAVNSLNQVICGRSRISNIDGQLMFRSFWITPYAGKNGKKDQGHYHYFCDVVDGKWKQLNVDCIRDCD